MRKIAFSYVLSWALGFIFMPTAYAEATNTSQSEYRIPTFDKIEFKAEASSDHRVSMSWSAFPGFNDEQFKYYKVIRSYSNPNPVYPEDGSIGVKMEIGDTRHTDEKATRSAYYRVCTITDVNGRHCSNAVWIEIEKTTTVDCKNWSSTGECQDAKIEKQKKEQEQKEWQSKQNEAKERLEAKKARQEAEKEKKQKEWEAKKASQKNQTDKKMTDAKASKEDRQAELYEKMYARLDMWLESFEKRMDDSSMSNPEKIERIETVQKKFYEWEQGKTVRIKMVDYIDEGLNDLKEKYRTNDDFSEIDAFLDGLLEN